MKQESPKKLHMTKFIKLLKMNFTVLESKKAQLRETQKRANKRNTF